MTTNFSLTRNNILFKACRMAGILESGELPEPELLNAAAESLNMIVKDLAAYGKKLWAVEEEIAHLSLSSVVTNDGKTYYCIRSHTSAAENEPGTGDNWKDYWYQAEPADSTPTDWALNTSYTNGGELATPDGTESIESIIIRKDDYDYPVTLLNRFQEQEIEQKWDMRTPEEARFDKNNQKIFFYPLPDQAYTVIYSRIRVLEDISLASDNPDVPQNLFSYLVFETAHWLAEEYDLEDKKITRLQSMAQVKLALALRKSVENTGDTLVDPAY